MFQRVALLILLAAQLTDGYIISKFGSTGVRSISPLASLNTFLSDKASNSKDNRIWINDDGTCVAAASGIKSNECIYSIPINECMDVKKAGTSLTWLASTAQSKLRTRDFGLLACYLLQEKARGDKSQYFMYINSLPEQAPGVLGWDDDLVQEFSQSTTRDISKQLDAIEADFNLISSTLTQSNTPHLGADFDVNRWKWAMGIVKDKHIYINGEPLLAPGIDFMAFDSYSENEAIIEGAGMFGGRVIKVVSRKEYKGGELVSVCPGFKSVAESVEDHGYISQENTKDLIDPSCELTVSINGEHQQTWDRYWEDKLDILELSGLKPTNQFDLTTEEELDPLLLQVLRLKFIRDKDSFILESIFRNTVMETLALPFSRGNEKLVFEFLKKTTETLIAQLGNVKSTLDKPQVVILQALRDAEIEALETTKTKVEDVLRTLESRTESTEYYQERRLRELDLLRPLDETEIVS